MTTPTETPTTDPIRDAFEAMIAFLTFLIGPPRTRLPTPAEEIGALAACEIDTDTIADEPPDALIKFRDLIQRAAEEHARRTWPQPADPTNEPPLTDEELRAAEERCERAPEGPWGVFEQDCLCWITGPTRIIGDEGEMSRNVAAFIAAARTDLPRALREIRRLRRIEALVGGLEQANREAHQGLAKRKAEIERLRSLLSAARRRLAPLPLAMHPEDHEPDTLPARIDAALGGKDH